MPVTEYKRFQTLVDDSDGWYTNQPSATFLEGGINGPSVYLAEGVYAILSDIVSFNIPSDATITGIEGTININDNAVPLTSDMIWNGKVSLSPITEGDLTDALITISPPGAGGISEYYFFGGDGELFGLNLTPSNVDNLKLGFKLVDDGAAAVQGNVRGTNGVNDGSFYLTPSPALRIHYITPSPSFRPGPNFMTLNSDLTKKKELKNKSSNLLQPPPNSKNLDTFGFGSDDLFGFSQDSTQKANTQSSTSTFGNPSKLGASRSVDSSTGLLDTSKAPITVRRGFQGL